MRAAAVVLLLFSGCIDFDAVEQEACGHSPACSDAGFFGNFGGGAGGGGAATGGGGGTTPGPHYCEPCTYQDECGGGSNFCLLYSTGPACGVDCSAVTCQQGYQCVPITEEDGGFAGRNCIPLGGLTCDGGIQNPVVDAGATDAGSSDAGAQDAGPTDAGLFDAGLFDAGVDAGTVDAGLGGVMDAGP